MKKLLLSLLCALTLTFNVKAQHYYPMLDSVNTWNYTSNFLIVARIQNIASQTLCGYARFAAASELSYYTAQDTVIHSKTYKTVYSPDGVNPCLYGFIRED